MRTTPTAFSRIPVSLPGSVKRNASGASGSCRGTSTNRSITSVTVETKGLVFFGPQTTNETHPFSRITLRASRTEIVVSHLSILRRLAHLTNRRNQNAVPVERISSTTAFAPLNNGSTVVIMSRKKATDSIAKS